MIHKAISIRQPWLWAILNAGKDVENRVWPTSFRGVILLHAGKGFTADDFLYLQDIIPGIKVPSVIGVERGAILGIATITDCVRGYGSKWSALGQYQFVLANPQPIEPLPYAGELGIFDADVPITIHNEICMYKSLHGIQ